MKFVPNVTKQAKIVVAIVILLVVAGGLIGWQISTQHHRKILADTTCSRADSGRLLHDAAANLPSNDLPALTSLVQKIQKLPNYNQDPNCMYILTTYYINKGDLTSAQIALTSFNRVYNNSKLSPQLTAYQNAASLRESVAYEQKTQKTEENNSLALPQLKE